MEMAETMKMEPVRLDVLVVEELQPACHALDVVEVEEQFPTCHQ